MKKNKEDKKKYKKKVKLDRSEIQVDGPLPYIIGWIVTILLLAILWMGLNYVK